MNHLLLITSCICQFFATAIASDVVIEFFIYKKNDLNIIQNDCFELSTNNREIVTIDKRDKHYSITIPTCATEESTGCLTQYEDITATLNGVISECPRMHKTYKIDNVLTRKIVTDLDKILLPICIIACFLALGFIIYYKNFSKYKNIVEIDTDSDDGSSNGDDNANDQRTNAYQPDEHGQSVDANAQNYRSKLDSQFSKQSSNMENIDRHDSVIPGKVKCISQIANNAVRPESDVDNMHQNGGQQTNITVNQADVSLFSK